MFEFLRGRVVRVTEREAVLDVGGVGYHLIVPAGVRQRIAPGDEGTFLVHLNVTEDALTLYGFSDPLERMIFRTILTVQGFGPAKARDLLSEASAELLRDWILNEDVASLSALRGLSEVTAKKLIVGLASRIKKVSVPASTEAVTPRRGGDARVADAMQALLVLGYPPKTAEAAVRSALGESAAEDPVEAVVRRALRHVS
jgi:Holliday junction DNA helicase RuvA